MLFRLHKPKVFILAVKNLDSYKGKEVTGTEKSSPDY